MHVLNRSCNYVQATRFSVGAIYSASGTPTFFPPICNLLAKGADIIWSKTPLTVVSLLCTSFFDLTIPWKYPLSYFPVTHIKAVREMAMPGHLMPCAIQSCNKACWYNLCRRLIPFSRVLSTGRAWGLPIFSKGLIRSSRPHKVHPTTKTARDMHL